ncbi:hypothetical protein ACB094_07G163300 [Castanea mollissima]
MTTITTTTTTTTTTDSDLRFSPSPPSLEVAVVPEKPRQKPRKKRTKLIRIDGMSTTGSSSGGGVQKPKYSKKPDPGAPKITRPCSECGKKFWSWKALFGHMRCHPERQWRGINPPPNLRRPGSPSGQPVAVMAPVVMSEEDHEIASCLLMLSSGVDRASDQRSIIEAEFDGFYRESMAAVECRFECSSCKKVFGSHQALGGHRASHKNVKGCFAITRSSASDGDEFDNVQDQSVVGHGDNERDDIGAALEEEKMLMVLGGHKCSICLRVFSSGQALGGHKRCHWEKGDEGVTTCGLDLNMPAPMEDGSSSSYTSTSGLTLDLRLGL